MEDTREIAAGEDELGPMRRVLFDQEVEAMWCSAHGDGTATVALFSMEGDRYFEGDVHLPTSFASPGRRFRVTVEAVQ